MMAGQKGNIMYRYYALVVQNADSKKVFMTTTYAKSEGEAKHNFHECYRHANYNILSVTAIPE